MKNNNSILKTFFSIIITFISVGIVCQLCIYINSNSDLIIKNINDFWYKNFNSYIFDTDETVNYDELIESGLLTNRDYMDSDFYPYYGMLNDTQKQIYYDILEGVNDYKTEVNPSRKIKIDDIKNTFYAVMYDHPELFWLDSKFSYEYSRETGEVVKLKLEYNSYFNNIDNNRKLFDAKVNYIIDGASNYTLDYEKEKYVHDSLIKHITFDETLADDQTAFGALVNSRAVCAGYAKAFQLIMTKLGIPTYYVSGDADGDHAWNMILLDDGYYHVDITWDDQKDKIIYKYFNVNEKQISSDHTRSELSIYLPNAEGKKYLNKYSKLGD